MEVNLKIIGKRIAQSRKLLGLTQDQLAEKADLSTQFINNVENGKKSMTLLSLGKVCRALSISADYLLFGEDDNSGNEIINSLLRKLPDYEREKAIKFLAAYVQITNEEEL